MQKADGLRQIHIPSSTELTEEDLLSLCADQAAISNMEHAIVTPKMRREFRKEIDEAAKRGWRKQRD